LSELVAALVLAGVLAWARYRGVESASLVSFLTTLVLMYQPAKDLSRYGQLGLQAAVAGERLHALRQAQGRLQDAPGARTAPPFHQALVLEAVHLDYGGRPALRGTHLQVREGQVTGLVGPSGAGKSTVARLLVRAARPDAGRILWGDADVEGFTLGSLRAQVALVTQEPLLFSGSVEENLRLGRPDATQAELELACQSADAHDFISKLPQGYTTRLEEGGRGLSGGQRQRLCLARALLLNAPLLVLDEATASLDPLSEREVQQALDRLLPGRTALVISHRLASLQHADRIYVMEEGRVVEEGTHESLLEQEGVYARLWRLQAPALGTTAPIHEVHPA
jgi:subfamily B ATP-binding cassette protein MsbA